MTSFENNHAYFMIQICERFIIRGIFLAKQSIWKPGYRFISLIKLVMWLFSDIDECKIPELAAKCVENAECCNLPAHYVCKCNPGFEGDGEVECLGKKNYGLNRYPRGCATSTFLWSIEWNWLLSVSYCTLCIR